MSNFNTSGLLQALDRIKPELKPLPQHFITSQDQHTRELYATLLAAVLLSDGQVSEPQSRLFGMLLQSMQLEPVPARFFELAQQLDAGQLKGAIRGIQPVGQSFALDALILARLSSPLNQQQLQLIAELFDVLEISQDLTSITDATAFVLGLSNKPELANIHIGVVNKSPILKGLWDASEIGDLFNKGVRTDPATGLMWSRISIGQQWVAGQAQGQAKQLNWDDANTACQEFRLADFDDWRLPTIKELTSISSQSQSADVLYPEPKKASIYWSSSECEKPNSPAKSWMLALSVQQSIQTFNVETHCASSEGESSNCYVRAVRSIR